MPLESEQAKEWLEQFFADVGLRWWPFMARRASRHASSFPKTLAAFAGRTEEPEEDVIDAADESDEFWAAQVEALRSLTKTEAGIPPAVAQLPAEELAATSANSPQLAALGRLVLGPFLLELMSTSRAKLERLERITDLDDGWLRTLGMLFEFTVMAKYLAVDVASAPAGKRDALESARQTALKAIGQLQGEEAARDNAGREVNDRRRNLLKNSEILGKLNSMADNRHEVLLRRFLESRGHTDVSLEGYAPASKLDPAHARYLCEKLGLPDGRTILEAFYSGKSATLCAAADSASRFLAAVTKAGATLPEGAREFFAAARAYLNNRNRAIFEYHRARRDEIGLDGSGSPEEEDDTELLRALHKAYQEAERQADEEEEIIQVDEASKRLNRSPTMELDHQQQMALALSRLNAPDLQLLWCLMRSRVAVVPNAAGNEVTERDTVYAVAANTTRNLIESGEPPASTQARAQLREVCERLQRTHASFVPGGPKASLFVETVNAALMWFTTRQVDAQALRRFTLSENRNGGFVLSPEARRGVARWKSDLIDQINKDQVAKAYLLPAISA